MSFLENFMQLIPLASQWIAEQEALALEKGIPLNEDQQIDAFLAGVKDPTKVRVLKVEQIPFPAAPILEKALNETGLLNHGTIGLSLRYGIFIRDDHWTDRRVLVHELVHTMQYERLGGIDRFLEQYVAECIQYGYQSAPMEQEARALEKTICGPQG